MSRPAWVNEYLTMPPIPFQERGRTRQGLDCYGLVWLVLREQFGVIMPSYDNIYTSIMDDDKIISMTIKEAAQKWKKVETPQEGDVVLFRYKGFPLHCGIMVDGDEMLNIRRGIEVCLESISLMHWKPRLYGIFRYA